MDINSLLQVADELDLLGFQKEATLVDRIICQQAQLLAHKEKPMLAQLAKIVLILKEFKPNEMVKGVDTTFPISGISLLGMTRQRAIAELQKHFEAYIQQYLIPTLTKKYKGTVHEAAYRGFIEQMQELSRSLSGLLPVHTEQQSIREVLTAIEQVKRALGRLTVHTRIQQEAGHTANPEAEEMVKQGVEILSDLESAIKRLNEEDVEDGIKRLKTLFPRDLSPKSPIYSLLYDAYYQGTLPFIGEKEVNERTLDRMDPSIRMELEKVDQQLKTLGDDRAKKQALLEQIDELEERFNVLVARINEIEARPIQPLSLKEHGIVYQNVYVPPKIYDYRNRYRKFDQVAGDITILERWLDNYLNDTNLNEKITFGQYLSKGLNPKMTQTAISIIQRNIADLRAEVEYDLSLIEKGTEKAERILLQNIGEKNYIANRVVWEEWYDKYISRLSQMLRYTLTPEVRGDESTEQAFSRILKQFRDLLNYEL